MYGNEELIVTEIGESITEAMYYNKSFELLHQWAPNYWPVLRKNFPNFYMGLSEYFVNWLHDENMIIKKEKNIWAIKLKKMMMNENEN